jgi:hypothetical protein
MLQAMLETCFARDRVTRRGRRSRSDGLGPGGLASEPWSLDDTAPTSDWEEFGRSTNETYKWPDGNVDRYTEFVSYHGTDGFTGMTLALGYLNNGDAVGFVLGTGGGSKRGITYFFAADDFEQTNEKVSMIRGGGPKGRSGFAPHEPLPRPTAASTPTCCAIARLASGTSRRLSPRPTTTSRCSATRHSRRNCAASPSVVMH